MVLACNQLLMFVAAQSCLQNKMPVEMDRSSVEVNQQAVTALISKKLRVRAEDDRLFLYVTRERLERSTRSQTLLARVCHQAGSLKIIVCGQFCRIRPRRKEETVRRVAKCSTNRSFSMRPGYNDLRGILQVFSHPNDHESRSVVRYAISKRVPMISVPLDEEKGEITSNRFGSVWKPSLAWESRSQKEC